MSVVEKIMAYRSQKLRGENVFKHKKNKKQERERKKEKRKTPKKTRARMKKIHNNSIPKPKTKQNKQIDYIMHIM